NRNCAQVASKQMRSVLITEHKVAEFIRQVAQRQLQKAHAEHTDMLAALQRELEAEVNAMRTVLVEVRAHAAAEQAESTEVLLRQTQLGLQEAHVEHANMMAALQQHFEAEAAKLAAHFERETTVLRRRLTEANQELAKYREWFKSFEQVQRSPSDTTH